MSAKEEPGSISNYIDPDEPVYGRIIPKKSTVLDRIPELAHQARRYGNVFPHPEFRQPVGNLADNLFTDKYPLALVMRVKLEPLIRIVDDVCGGKPVDFRRAVFIETSLAIELVLVGVKKRNRSSGKEEFTSRRSLLTVAELLGISPREVSALSREISLDSEVLDAHELVMEDFAKLPEKVRQGLGLRI